MHGAGKVMTDTFSKFQTVINYSKGMIRKTNTLLLQQSQSVWFDFSTKLNKPISAQCCVSYRKQSFFLLCTTNDSFLCETPQWAEIG